MERSVSEEHPGHPVCASQTKRRSGSTAGQDATEAFYGLHRNEVIEKPQYKRLQIGVIGGEQSVITGRIQGELSKVPYAEPTWLADGYHNPYYTEVRFKLQRL